MTTRKLRWWIGASMVATTAVAAAQGPPPPETDELAETAPCPMAAAQIEATEVPGGAAIELTTRGDVDVLRAQVRRMAAMRNAMTQRMGARGHNMGGGMMGRGNECPGPDNMGDGMMGGGMMGGGMMGMRAMVPSHATVEDIPGGARLVLEPRDPDQLDTLRAQTRAYAEMMSDVECPWSPAPPDR